MESIIILNTTRTHYCKEEAADSSMTVKELIEILEDFDEDSSVIFSNDNGYTYGKIQSYNITEAEYKTDYEEEEENDEE